MGQVLTKNEGFGDFCEGWIPFLLEIKQKTGWLVGMIWACNNIHRLDSRQLYSLLLGHHPLSRYWISVDNIQLGADF